MYNTKLFSHTYICSYIISIISTYSIYILVIIFAWNNNNMRRYHWEIVIYPQCLWLLPIKLYHNEISQIINVITDQRNTNDDNCAKMKNKNIYLHVRRLFLMQFAVLILNLYVIVIYGYFLIDNHPIYKTSWRIGSSAVWTWQLFLSVSIFVVMVVAIRVSMNEFK